MANLSIEFIVSNLNLLILDCWKRTLNRTTAKRAVRIYSQPLIHATLMERMFAHVRFSTHVSIFKVLQADSTLNVIFNSFTTLFVYHDVGQGFVWWNIFMDDSKFDIVLLMGLIPSCIITPSMITYGQYCYDQYDQECKTGERYLCHCKCFGPGMLSITIIMSRRWCWWWWKKRPRRWGKHVIFLFRYVSVSEKERNRERVRHAKLNSFWVWESVFY